MVRNRKSRDQAMQWRRFIYVLHAVRTQAEPRLTIEDIRQLCGCQLSVITVRRHLAWLRARGYLSD
jgi:hypothetical protein